ncbi:hypothetical protein SUGI_1148540 [Cryptomeria japonica]|nr:hypothetical protein SUGI_1148540 [Cryptomeria japonica]
MTVRRFPKLEELPHGFQALPALKSFKLTNCTSLQNLPARFGKLKILETLHIDACYKLESLPDDFESLASLTGLRLWTCPNLDSRAMERIVKLKLCYWVRIEISPKLIERWGEMREKEEYPMVVSDGISMGEGKPYFIKAGGCVFKVDEEEVCRAARVGLLGARCITILHSTTQQLQFSSILFEVDTIIAVIALPVHVEDHHLRLIETLVGMVMEKAKMASTGRLQIVYVKRVKNKGETTEKEKLEEEKCFQQILMLAPRGSCAIPSNDIRWHRLITSTVFISIADNKLGCQMLKMLLDDKGNKILQFNDCIKEDDISGESLRSSESVYKECENSNDIGNFIESICAGSLSGTTGLSQFPPKESMLTEFLQILKKNNAIHLIDNKLDKVELDQLKGKVVGIFISDRNTPEYIKLLQIYKEFRDKSLNFEVLWIPLFEHESYGLGTYTRALQKMVWTALAHLISVKVKKREPHFIIFDQEGSIGNPDAMSAIMLWGAGVYPFTKNKIDKIVVPIDRKSSLDFLFHNINLVLTEYHESLMVVGAAACENLIARETYPELDSRLEEGWAT